MTLSSLSLPCAAEQLLPHKGRMCCIDRLTSVQDQEATAEVLLRADHVLLNDEGLFERCGFIELAAQTAGAMQGAHIIMQGVIPSMAMLAGIQNVEVYADANRGDKLVISVTTLGDLEGMSSLSFMVKRADTLLAKGRLKVFMPASI